MSIYLRIAILDNLLSLNSNTTGATSGAGTANKSGALNFLPRSVVGFMVQYKNFPVLRMSLTQLKDILLT